MTPNRKVYQVKRYSRRRRGFSLATFIGERKLLFACIAAAVVVIVVLNVLGVFTGHPAKNTAQASQVATVTSAPPSSTPVPTESATPSPSESATPSPSGSASPSPSASPSASASAARVLSLTDPHMQGDDVKALQEKLGLNADGSFGPSTKAALMAYQKAHGLTADGYAGPDTLAKLGLQ